MSGSFDVTAATASINMTAGGAGAAGTGGYTIAVLAQPATGNNNAGLCGLYASATLNRAFFEDTNHLFGNNDFSSGFGTLTQGTWYLCIQSKPAGSALYDFDLWPYASDGSGTMSRGPSTGAASQGDGSAITEIRIGANAIKGNGLVAVLAVWNRQLTSLERDSMKSGSLSAWNAVSGGPPVALLSLENWNGSTGCVDLVGTSALSTITGTVAAGANPPGFSFSLAATSTSVFAVPLIGPGRSGPGGQWQLPAFAGGQSLTCSLAGLSSPSGTLAKQDQKALAAASGSSGALAKAASKTAAGSSTSSGALIKVAGKALSGTSAATGVIARASTKAFAAASGSAGALAKQVGKALASASVSSGAISLTRVILRAFGGSSTPTGVIAKAITRLLGGASTPSGALSTTGGAAAVKASSTAAVTAGRTSTSAVTAKRTSTDAVTARRTSSGGVS